MREFRVPDFEPVRSAGVATARGLLTATILAVVFVALTLAAFVMPYGDDYVRARRARSLGVPQCVALEYKTTSGRWAGTGASYLLSATTNLERTCGPVVAGIGATAIAGAYALLGALFGSVLSRAERALLAATYFALYWTGSPCGTHGHYWLTGSLENLLSIALGVFTLAGLVRCGQSPGRRWTVVAGLSALAFLTVGFHELYGSILVLILGAGAAVSWAVGHPARRSWAAVATAAAVGLAVVVAAPGNFRRMAIEAYWAGRPAPHDLATLQTTARIWFDLYRAWALDPKLLGASLLLFALPRFHSSVPEWLRTRRRLWAVTVPAFSLLALALPIAAIWWAIPGVVPSRTQSAIHLIFLAGWFACGFVWLAGLRPGEACGLPGRVRLAMTLLVSLAVLTTGQFRPAVADLCGRAGPYAAAVRWRTTWARAAAARGDRRLTVAPLPAIPECFGGSRLELGEEGATEVTAPLNKHFAKYCGLHTIGLPRADARR